MTKCLIRALLERFTKIPGILIDMTWFFVNISIRRFGGNQSVLEAAMYQANEEGQPTPLAGMLDEGGSAQRPVITHIAHNMGNRSFLFTLPMKEFYDMSEVANERGEKGEPVAQRALNLPHATKLAAYMLKGLISATILRRQIQGKVELPALEEMQRQLGKQPYISIQPMVCNLRNVDPSMSTLQALRLTAKETGETASFKVFLELSHLLFVVDGQHRRKGMQLMFEFLRNTIQSKTLGARGNLLSPVKGALTDEQIAAFQEIQETASGFATVQIECHIGLDVLQERQLFHDLNNLGKKIESSLALEFDNSNPVNVFIKEVLIDDDSVFDWPIIEKDIVDWSDDTGAISRKDLVSINARLFMNKTNISGAKPSQVEVSGVKVSEFWLVVAEIPGVGRPQAKLNTVAAQPVMLKALAKLYYDFALGRKPNEELAKKLLEGIPHIDFSHTNPMWRYYQLTEGERQSNGLASLRDYLPSDEEGFNRDIGNFDANAKTMRFGAKHNDIFPILGDMVRWSVNLPNRHKTES
jgi:hypothetical protein